MKTENLIIIALLIYLIMQQQQKRVGNGKPINETVLPGPEVNGRKMIENC